MSFFDSIVPAVISAGTSLLSNSQTNSANRQAADINREAYEDAARIYGDAYDERLDYDLDSLLLDGTLSAEELASVSQLLGGQTGHYQLRAADAYGRFAPRVDEGLDEFSFLLDDGAGKYSDLYQQAAGRYDDAINPAYAEARGNLNTGYAGAGQSLAGGYSAAMDLDQPFYEGGQEAMTALRGILAVAPDEMDPAQRRLRDKSIRDMRANLAASGLRGAGRAGVAAVNEGIAEMDASLYGQNRDRIDRAAEVLAGYGAGASSRLGSRAVGLGQDVASLWTRQGENLADLSRRQGELTADNWRRALSQIADNNMSVSDMKARQSYNTAKDKADTGLKAENAVAQFEAARGSEAINALQDFYARSKDRAGAEADARGSNIMGKADAEAAAKLGGSFGDQRATLASGRSNADTIGALGSIGSSVLSSIFSGGGSGALPSFG